MLQEKHAAPTVTDLEALIERISLRVGRHLERRGLLERDAENAYLEWDAEQASSLDDLAGHAITYRIAVGPNRGQKAFTLQTLPAVETDPARPALVARAGRFSLHAGVAARCGPTRPQAALGKTKGASSEAGVPRTCRY